MKKLLMLVMVLGLLVSGCVAIPLATNSGYPEVTICETSKEEVLNFLVASISTGTGGFIIESSSNFQIIASKSNDTPVTRALVGPTRVKVILTLYGTRPGCIVISGRIMLYTQDGPQDLSQGKSGQELQQQLEGLKREIDQIIASKK